VRQPPVQQREEGVRRFEPDPGRAAATLLVILGAARAPASAAAIADQVETAEPPAVQVLEHIADGKRRPGE